MKIRSIVGGGLAVALLGLTLPVAAQMQAPQGPSPAQTSLASAQRNQKYLFILFWKEENAGTQAMRQTLEGALAQRPNQAASVLVKTTDPAEKAVVDQFGVSRSPMPLVVAVAPNGAITGGFPLKLTEQEVAGAFVSPGTASCLKGAQARKLVLLCVLSADSTDWPVGVRDFKSDAQYQAVTELVAVRAGDATEAAFLQSIGFQPQTAVPFTALIAPPGRVLGTFEGAVTKQQLVEKLASAQNGCCPGGKCGPGGCSCPGGKCGPQN